jgi:hypothetical protein|tara:strand:+ start:590 stop:832 length:243 start_codon:yes stop_codon:yes gene_type:complete
MNTLVIGFFSIILSLLLLVLFYVNKNIKTFINIENNDIKMYLKLFGILFSIIFILLFIITLSKSFSGDSSLEVHMGDPGF